MRRKCNTHQETATIILQKEALPQHTVSSGCENSGSVIRIAVYGSTTETGLAHTVIAKMRRIHPLLPGSGSLPLLLEYTHSHGLGCYWLSPWTANGSAGGVAISQPIEHIMVEGIV